MRLIASLMCAPTLAMYGSSIAWMCSPPMCTTSRSDTNSPQPPSGLRVAYALEDDRVVVVAVGRTGVTCPSYGSILAVSMARLSRYGRALVLDDAAGDLHAAP